MRQLKRFIHSLGRNVTVLVIPHTDLPMLRGRFSLFFLLFVFAAWTGLVVWAGFLVGHRIDYWVTKADNMVIRGKMTYMADEMDKSRDMLRMAQDTDQQLRSLLGLSGQEKAAKDAGGEDEQRLARIIEDDPQAVSESSVHKTLEQLRAESESRLASFQEIAWHISNRRSLARATPNIWPTRGRITSGFGYRFSPMRPRTGGGTRNFHEGVDIANRPDTPIVATADGVVRHADWSSGFGIVVVIDHGFGYSTVYGHTSKAAVKPGDRVRRGQMIAYMGTSGRSTGTHLHYEVLRHGKPVNPVSYLGLRDKHR